MESAVDGKALAQERAAGARLLSATSGGNSSVLDLGCNDGLLIPFLSSNFERVLGVDLTLDQLRLSVERSRGSNNTSFALIAGDDLAAIRDASFDAVFSRDVFIHLPGPTIERYWAEIYRILRPGGVLVFNLLGNWPSLTAGVYWTLRLKPRYAVMRLLGRELPIDWIHPDMTRWNYLQKRLPIGRPYRRDEVIDKLRGNGYEQLVAEKADASIWITARKPAPRSALEPSPDDMEASAHRQFKQGLAALAVETSKPSSTTEERPKDQDHVGRTLFF